MKKVLFITYYWPPSVKASLHWPLKMIKYLPQYGWQPSVLTVAEDTFSEKDNSMFAEISNDLQVIKARSLEPFNLYKKFTGKKKDEQLVASETISKSNKSITHRISIWIRMNLFIPDARIGWYLPAVKRGEKYLRKEKIDAIITIGPPHTTHLVGMKLSKEFNIPHFPVFIDPWVDIVYYKNFKRSRPTLALDNYLEQKVLRKSGASIFVTRTMMEDYIKKYPFLQGKSYVLYWGYDEEDFTNITPGALNSQDETIVHAGNIFDFQNTPVFWRQVKKEIEKGRRIKIKFIGTVSPGIRKTIADCGLEQITEYLGYLPYNKMLDELNKASYLLVCSTEPRHVPGKLFEYLRIGKPVIAFGNDNDEVKNILKETNAGMMFRYDESAEEIFDLSNCFKRDLLKIESFNRSNIAKELSIIISKNLGLP